MWVAGWMRGEALSPAQERKVRYGVEELNESEFERFIRQGIQAVAVRSEEEGDPGSLTR
jgi:hypothetical protein